MLIRARPQAGYYEDWVLHVWTGLLSCIGYTSLVLVSVVSDQWGLPAFK